LIIGCLTSSSPITTKPRNATQPFVGPDTQQKESKTFRCDDPGGYSVEEESEPEAHLVKFVRGGSVVHTIKTPTGANWNNFALDGVKKTKAGFEISIEYGSVIYYNKRFIFICRQHQFYLSKIIVESFNKHNPEKWTRRVIRVQPMLRVEKFSITDFMQEGVVKDKK
jgi:hypothetical protein